MYRVVRVLGKDSLGSLLQLQKRAQRGEVELSAAARTRGPVEVKKVVGFVRL